MSKGRVREGIEEMVKEAASPSSLHCCGALLVMDSLFLLPVAMSSVGGGAKYTDEVGVVHVIESYDPKKSVAENAVLFYQHQVSEELHQGEHICKLEPSCSEYALQAIKKYGPAKGSMLAAERLARCSPLGKGGEDPLV
jgi:putative membrane protein insertion efficiency factor